MRVFRLEGPLLNYWVAKSEGLELVPEMLAAGQVGVVNPESGQPIAYQPAFDWSQGGPIVSNEWYGLEDLLNDWFGPQWPHLKAFRDDPLTWLMRGFVALRFGNDVEDVTLGKAARR